MFQNAVGRADEGDFVAAFEHGVGGRNVEFVAAFDVADFHGGVELDVAQAFALRLCALRNFGFLQFNLPPREVFDRHSFGVADVFCKLHGGQRFWVYENVYAELLLVVYKGVVGVYLVVNPCDCGFCAELFAYCAGDDIELVESGHRQQEVAVRHARERQEFCRRAVPADYPHVEVFLNFVRAVGVGLQERYTVPVLAEDLAKVVPHVSCSDYYYFHIYLSTLTDFARIKSFFWLPPAAEKIARRV